VVDPVSHLRGLPVIIVNEDQGATVQSQVVDVGKQVESGLKGSSAVASRLSLTSLTLAQAKTKMDENAAYATIVIPAEFTDSLLSLHGLAPSTDGAPPLPAVELLTNVRTGSLGVSLASGVASPALRSISLAIGQSLKKQEVVGGQSSASATALRAGPISVMTVPFRPLPEHSALGLSAFYISLLTIMCGFLGATLVNSTIDAALGYATNEIGPKWR
jgi:YhgE/Pip-like protein